MYAECVQFAYVLGLSFLLLSGDNLNLENVFDFVGLFLALSFLLSLVLLFLAPLWGRKLIGLFSGTSPAYWRVAGLAVWLPMGLAIVWNVLLGSLFGDESAASLVVAVMGQVVILALAANIFCNRESRDAARVYQQEISTSR